MKSFDEVINDHRDPIIMQKRRKEGIELESHKLIPTAEDWYPCYFTDTNSSVVLARVSIHKPSGIHSWTKREDLEDAVKYWVRTSFWGNDDTGIEKDRYVSTLEEAMEIYFWQVRWLSNLAIVSRSDLLKLGFQHS
jgi:hypothetical protein